MKKGTKSHQTNKKNCIKTKFFTISYASDFQMFSFKQKLIIEKEAEQFGKKKRVSGKQ